VGLITTTTCDTTLPFHIIDRAQFIQTHQQASCSTLYRHCQYNIKVTMSSTPLEKDNSDAGETTCKFVGDGTHKPFLERKMALRVVRYATKTVEQLNNSEEFQEQKQKAVHAPLDVHHFQIELGDLLGQGTFSGVFEIKNSSVECIEPSRYVVKVLREKMINDPGLFAASAAGLVTEATILSLLDHENIVRVKAWSHRGVCGYSSGKNDAFFIVLDRLDEILSDRIISWRHKADKLRYFVRHRHMKLDRFFSQRIEVARDLARAVSYLHEHRIIHRDIKPANVGFQKGTLKLLDFDVSRMLPKGTEENQRFNLTGMTGTRRYMSPECGLHQPYNEKTDVYSFAIILNEIIALEKAFTCLSKREHELGVFCQGVRPWIPHSCPKRIRMLVQHSWSQDIAMRPSMAEIHELLVEELTKTPAQPSPSRPSRLRFRPFKMLKVFPPAIPVE
jgi:serine/threonine protein kinase